jgi:simple sugar transport system ATP-binding protein
MKLELAGISKRFPGVVANDGIDLTVGEGEIHALLGENGAGKTTLMNVLFGLYSADEGEIRIDGRPRTFSSPGDAIAAGIGMVHQHFMLIPVFTVAENVMLGQEETGPFGLLDRREAERRVRDISATYRLEVDPGAVVEELSVGAQQRVEIVKALYRQAELLILDEPTAVLTPQEIDELFTVMRSLRESGKSIIFITHKLKEVLAIADRITVLRRGRVEGTTTPKESNEQALAAMMVGHDVRLEVEKGPAEPGEPALVLEDLRVLDDRGQAAVDGVSLEVRAGEILGIAGVQGNGQTELIEVLAGLRRPGKGTVRLDGVDVTAMPPAARFARGLAHVAEDRHLRGLVLDFTLAENLLLGRQRERDMTGRLAVLRRKRLQEFARERLVTMDVQPPVAALPARALSGGNQQKVVIARELSRPKLRFLIVAQPTRGVDIGATELIWQAILEARDAGAAVLLISAELSELRALSTRIAVMHRGHIVDTLPVDRATDEKLGALMTGAA